MLMCLQCHSMQLVCRSSECIGILQKTMSITRDWGSVFSFVLVLQTSKNIFLNVAIPPVVEVHLEVYCFLCRLSCSSLSHRMFWTPPVLSSLTFDDCSSALLLSRCLSPSTGWFPQQALRIWIKLQWPGWISTVLFLFWGQVSKVLSSSYSRS